MDTMSSNIKESAPPEAPSVPDLERSQPVQKAAPPPPPDGGSTAWLQVAGAFFLFFNSWGVINTFGVYQTYYENTLLPDYSASSISWIGTIQGFLLFLAGIVAGPIFDKGYLKALIAVGSFLVVFGLMMTSLSTKYYQVFLAHGITVGIGCAFLFLPSVAIVATYFTSKRALATGITASGGSIGAVIYPIIFHRLLPRVGFGWTTRIIAFIALACLLFSLATMKMRLPPPKTTRSLLDLSAFKEIPFILFSLALFFAFIGLYFPFFYLPTYLTTALNSDPNIAFYSIAIINAGSIFGRIAPGLLADQLGSLNTIVPMAFSTSILAFAWIGIRNVAGTLVFSVLYGFFSGAIVSLPTTILASLTSDMSVLGTRMGMSFSFAGLGLLIGNPIAGALLDLDKGVFWKGQVFAAVMVVVGAVLFLVLRGFVGLKLRKGWKI
ncbi:major facilitator superfamily domain-containing protein [Aspergillus pseudodeflectus]|uniref:Major facilitator superfamily domain-containing protein n=1 Tax=Aspergillus pseudodeflectus TaxID=176178 RepID=A0ABR4LBY0_9EURO